MPESTDLLTAADLVQYPFPIMAKRNMSKIMPESYGLYEILIQAQSTPDCPANFRHELHVENPMRNVIVLE
jgi:hypothetical protein